MFNLFDLITLSGNAQQPSKAGGFGSIAIMLVMFVAMYFLLIRPQKKQQKEAQNMRDSIQVGDEITTIGGIMGRVITVKDDSLVIETGAGAERTRIHLQRWAIQSNDTANERMEAERKAAQEAKKAKNEKAAIDAKVDGKPKKTKTVKNTDEEKAEEKAEEKTEE